LDALNYLQNNKAGTREGNNIFLRFYIIQSRKNLILPEQASHVGICIVYNVRVKSNREQAPPGNLTFEKIIGQMPARTGRNHSQMPCYRGSPGSGILAKIKFNKHFKFQFCSTGHIVSYIYD
jgi:hypothetical protein